MHIAPLAFPPEVNVAQGVVPPVDVMVVDAGGVVVSQTVPVSENEYNKLPVIKKAHL